MSQQVLKPYLWDLAALFESIYEVPVYQRPYSWGTDEVSVLLNDIIETYTSEDKDSGLYTGNIIIYDKKSKISGRISKYDIIDGQQRITTFSLIILALYSLSIENNVSENDPTISSLKRSLWKFVDRKYSKELPSVTLNSIEKKSYSELFNKAFDFPKNLESFCKNYIYQSTFDAKVIKNFSHILKFIRDNIFKENSDNLLDFAEYILKYIHFIVIEADCRENKVFSMFESINSKGKKLEDIDLIKTYIFSKLDENTYDNYLNIWGQLIIKTKDKLYDYLYNYIKAYIRFYRQNISVDNFKSVAKNEFPKYYRVATEKEALEKFLEDLNDKVDFYGMLSNAELANSLVKHNKFRFFFKVFTEISYQHPKALFFRLLDEISQGKISKEDATEIVTQTIGFMIKFLSLGGGDSKDSIATFYEIMRDIYNKNIDKQKIIDQLNTTLYNKAITTEKLKAALNEIDAYSRYKKISVAFLALFESTSKEGKVSISYDQAYNLLDAFGTTFSLDHLLVQTPSEKDPNFKYFKDKNECLALKNGHDFPESLVINGMDYDLFTRKILNKIGNLRLLYKDKNASRQNSVISLQSNNYSAFNNFKNIQNRGKEIADLIFDLCLPQGKLDLTTIKLNNKRKIKNNYLTMEQLIEKGLIKLHDKIYLTANQCNEKDSEAELIDDNNVIYKGKKLTINQWAKTVTGWSAVNIYENVAIVGEEESLHEKRIKYMKENGIPTKI